MTSSLAPTLLFKTLTVFFCPFVTSNVTRQKNKQTENQTRPLATGKESPVFSVFAAYKEIHIDEKNGIRVRYSPRCAGL